jgi:hypothetical protein
MISDLMMSCSRMFSPRIFNLIVIAGLISGVFLTACSAQTASNYQNIGGDFGREWIGNFMDKIPTPAENNSSNFWDWGSAPKGSKIVNGKLVADTIYNQTWENSYYNWLGDTYVDSSTGNQIYSHADPNTGLPSYYYIDPKTGEPVSVDADSATGEPLFATLPFVGTSAEGSSYPELPPIFSSSNPWT